MIMERLDNYDFHRSAVIRFVIAAAALALFIVDAYLVQTGRTEAVDQAVGSFARSTRGPVTDPIWIVITYAAYKMTIIGEIAVLILIPRTRLPVGVPAALSSTAGLIVYKIMKTSFARPRPDRALWLITEHGFSFPSGHSMNGLIFYGLMMFMIRRYCRDRKTANILTVLLSLLILGIGWSRIFVGVHYVTDVAGGLLMGLCWVMLVSVLLDWIVEKRKDEAWRSKSGISSN
jgi:undecaprenyl-diphosphatase